MLFQTDSAKNAPLNYLNINITLLIIKMSETKISKNSTDAITKIYRKCYKKEKKIGGREEEKFQQIFQWETNLKTDTK